MLRFVGLMVIPTLTASVQFEPAIDFILADPEFFSKTLQNLTDAYLSRIVQVGI